MSRTTTKTKSLPARRQVEILRHTTVGRRAYGPGDIFAEPLPLAHGEGTGRFEDEHGRLWRERPGNAAELVLDRVDVDRLVERGHARFIDDFEHADRYVATQSITGYGGTVGAGDEIPPTYRDGAGHLCFTDYPTLLRRGLAEAA
jgi:hypothetical protein